MRRLYPVLLSAAIFLSFMFTRDDAQAQPAVNFQVFYDQLSPYGSWVNYQQYGYVWIPTSVDNGFRPYGSGGHWVYTEDGWTWVSDYDWGWAPFHYGNWFYDDSYGWMWAPGYDWAPAWVTWGEYNGNYCWAPVGPNINIGVAFGSYRPPSFYWNFVPRAYIGRPNIGHYYVNNYHTNVTVINHITIVNNVYQGSGRPQFMRGPRANAVEKYTHQPIRPVTIRAANAPGRGRVQNGQLAIYRPPIARNAGSRPAAPARVQNVQSLQPTALPGRNRPGNGNGRPSGPNKPAANPSGGNRPAIGGNRPSTVTQPVHPASRPVTAPSRPTPAVTAPVRPNGGNSSPNTQYNHPVMNSPSNANHPPANRPTANPPHNQPSARPSATYPNVQRQPRPVQQPQQRPASQPQRPVQQPRPAEQQRPVQRQPQPVQQPQQRPEPQPQRPEQPHPPH